MSAVFEVAASAEDVAAFRRAAQIADDVGDALPFTYPIRWLAAPQVRAAIVALVPGSDVVPFHESQTFDYVAPLRVGTGYTLDVSARREPEPDRIVVEAEVRNGGARMARLETVLRLFSTQAAQHV